MNKTVAIRICCLTDQNLKIFYILFRMHKFLAGTVSYYRIRGVESRQGFQKRLFIEWRSSRMKEGHRCRSGDFIHRLIRPTLIKQPIDQRCIVHVANLRNWSTRRSLKYIVHVRRYLFRGEETVTNAITRGSNLR